MTRPIDVLLVGARVAQLKPHFEVRGYRCDAFVDGSLAMTALEAKHRDLVVLEINLGDQTAPEFVDRARASEPHAAYLLLDDASRAGQIVKALQAGVTHYLPTPPDETRLFRDVDQLVIFSRAMSGDLEREHKLALADAQAAAETAQGDASRAAMQTDLVQQELLTANTKRDELTAEVESLKRRVEELRHQGIESASKLDEMEALSKKSADLKEERASLEERLTEAEQARDEHQARASELESKLSDVEGSAEERKQRIGELEAALAEQTQLAEERGAELARALDSVAALEKEKAALEERAIDLDLQVDEINTKLAFIEEQRREADARAQELEARFKKDRLRLIEEKQHAAAGSHEAFQKMEKLVGELAQLRAQKAEAEARLKELQGKAASATSDAG